jgi:hypothetical protein
MIGEKRLSEIKAEVAALLRKLPGGSARAWFRKEIASAKTDSKRNVKILEMLCAALEDEVGKATRPSRRKPVRRKARVS